MKILVETFDQWSRLKMRLAVGRYECYCMSGRFDSAEGFYTAYWAKDKPIVELKTFAQDIQDDMKFFTGRR